jgi:hypothetical protein
MSSGQRPPVSLLPPKCQARLTLNQPLTENPCPVFQATSHPSNVLLDITGDTDKHQHD